MNYKREQWMPKAANCCGFSCITLPIKLVFAEYNCKALNSHANKAEPKKSDAQAKRGCLRVHQEEHVCTSRQELPADVAKARGLFAHSV